MKILHFGTIDVNVGGPAMSIYLTLKGLRKQGVDAQLIMFQLSKGSRLRGEDILIHYAKSPLENKFCYAPHLKDEIRVLGQFDIYHVQGVWTYPTYAIIDEARRADKPYIITPRGMLYPQDIKNNSEVAKRISLKLRLKNDLNRAACIQATCVKEMEYCRELGVTSPIAVIPNPVEIVDYKECKKDDLFRLGYLGRLSPRKNVEGLIYAWGELRSIAKDAELLIIGSGDAEYERFLKNEVKRLNLNSVRFTGFLNGKEKDRAIASLSVLAMPSEFENLGNAILEGLVRQIPCIVTKGAPWQELETEHCGWWVDYSKKAITEAVKLALCCSSEELSIMGMNGRKLMERKYSVIPITSQMKTLYEYILGDGYKPDFVYD